MLELELTKPQILELYLNRVYLSAGVYGVETMSEHLFRKPAQRPDASRSGARSPGWCARPRRCRPGATTTGRSSGATSCWRRCATRSSSRRAGSRGASGAAAHPVVPAVARGRDAAGRRNTCASSSANEFGGDHPPDWQRADHLRSPACRTPRRRRLPPGCSGWNGRGLEAALVALDPQTGDMLAMVGGADYMRSTFNRATRGRRQPGRRSSRSSTRRRSSTGFRRCRC